MDKELLTKLAKIEAKDINSNSVWQQIGFSKSLKFDTLSNEDQAYYNQIKSEATNGQG